MPFLEKTISSPLYFFGAFVESCLTVNARAYFWALNSIPLINSIPHISALLPVIL